MMFLCKKDGNIEFQVTKSKRYGFLNLHYPAWEMTIVNPYRTSMCEDFRKTEIALLVFATNKEQYQEFLEWVNEV